MKEIANHSDENDTPEPILDVFTAALMDERFMGMEWHSEIVAWQVQVQSLYFLKASPKAAQRASCAKVKGQQKVVSIAPKRHVSAAGLARIRAAQRARWKVRAAKK